MKKILLAGCVLLMSVGYAQAAVVWDGAVATKNPPMTDLTNKGYDKTALASFKVSNNVTMTVASGPSSYAATSGHLNGTRTFAASSGDTLMHYQDKDVGTTAPAPASGSVSNQFDSWSAL